MKKSRLAPFRLLSILILFSGVSQYSQSAVFENHQPIAVSLIGPLSTLVGFQKNDDLIKAKEQFVNLDLQYTDEENRIHKIPVKAHLKGFSTVKSCTFPKLELKLPKSLANDNLFYGIKSIDLNTHCVEENESASPSQAFYQAALKNHREAFLYKLAEILDINTYKARPIWIKYSDTDQPSNLPLKPDVTYQAFFLEDFSEFRKRLEAKSVYGTRCIEPKIVLDPAKKEQCVFDNLSDSPKLQVNEVFKMSVFQYLIGNSDWFIQLVPNEGRFGFSPATGDNLWNVKVIEYVDNKWQAIPHDFNFSMILLDYVTKTTPEGLYLKRNFELGTPSMRSSVIRQMESKLPLIKNEIQKWNSISDFDQKIMLEKIESSFELLLSRIAEP